MDGASQSLKTTPSPSLAPGRSESEEDIIMALSVAEKRSLFMQMEQDRLQAQAARRQFGVSKQSSVDGGLVYPSRWNHQINGSGTAGRIVSKRFGTQPVTAEELKAAESLGAGSGSPSSHAHQQRQPSPPVPTPAAVPRLNSISEDCSDPGPVTPVTNANGDTKERRPRVPRRVLRALPVPTTVSTDKLPKMLIKVEENGSGDPAPRGPVSSSSLPMPSLKERVRMFNGLARANSNVGAGDGHNGDGDNNNASRYKYSTKRTVVSKRFSTTPVNGIGNSGGGCGGGVSVVAAYFKAVAKEFKRGSDADAVASAASDAVLQREGEHERADSEEGRAPPRARAARTHKEDLQENKLLLTLTSRQGQDSATQVEQQPDCTTSSTDRGTQIINTCTTDTKSQASAPHADGVADLPKPKREPNTKHQALEVQGQEKQQQNQEPLLEPPLQTESEKTQKGKASLEKAEDSSRTSAMGVHSLKEDADAEHGAGESVVSVRNVKALFNRSDMGNSNSSSNTSGCLGVGVGKRRASDFSAQSHGSDKLGSGNGSGSGGSMGMESNNNRIVSFVKKQLLSRSSSCNFPKMDPLEIPYDDPTSPQTAPIDSSPPGSGSSTRSNRIKEKIAALKTNGEISWMKRVPGKKVPIPVVPGMPGYDNQEQEQDENQNKDENTEPLESKNNKESSNVIAARLSLLEKSQEGWKKRISESDATAFTVQGRLEKAGKLSKSSSGSQCHNNNAKNLNLTPTTGGDQKKLSPSKLMFSKSQHELSVCLMKHQQQDKEKKNTKDANANLGAGDSVVDGGKLSTGVRKSPTVATVPVPRNTTAKLETSSSSESNAEDDVILRSIAANDNETFTKFFASPTKAKSSESSSPAIDDASFSSLINTPTPHKLLGVRRNVKVNRKHAASRNPVKVLAERATASEQAYFEVAPEVREKEMKKRAQIDALAKNSQLSVEALAGLASKEDFSAVKLKAAAISTQQFPHPMLLQIKGKRYVQTRLVPPAVSSINSGDCFVLVTDSGDTIYQYIGEFSNRMERSKLADVVTHLTQRRDLGCGSSTKVYTLEDPFSILRYEAFIKALGGGNVNPEEDELGDEHDEAYELGVIKTNRVYEVDENKEELLPCESDGGNGWGSQPRHSMLKDDKVLVFDFGSEMYVWSGSKADLKLKKLGSKLAKKMFDDGYKKNVSGSGDEFSPLAETNRPSWCWFKRVVQFMEPILFREKFFDWPDEGRFSKHLKSLSPKRGAEAGFNFQACNPKEMEAAWRELEDAGLELQGFNVGRGDTVRDKERRTYVINTENLVAWHISEFSTEKMLDPEMPHFYSSETYVIRWSYIVTTTGRDLKGNISKQAGVRGRERTAYFFWHGLGSSITEKGTSALMTVELDEEKGPQIRVVQGTEPPAFLNLFGGLMFIHDGSPEKCAKKEQRLYVAIGGSEQEGHFHEVVCEPTSFRSGGSFLYLTKKTIFVWHGQNSCCSSRKIAVAGAKYLSTGQIVLPRYAGLPIVEVEELKESKQFMESLKISSVSKWRDSYASHRQGLLETELQIFRFSTLSGSFEAVPVPSVRRKADLVDPFPALQEELYGAQQPSLFLISTPEKTYLWQGWLQAEDEENSNSTTGSLSYRWAAERKAALETAIAYSAHRGHEGCLVHSGLEPPEFVSLFPSWRVNEEAAAYNAGKAPRIPLADALRPFKKSSYTLEELHARPEGVDVLKLEAYLSDDEFEKLLKMSREEFGKLQSWKKSEIKKQAGLF